MTYWEHEALLAALALSLFNAFGVWLIVLAVVEVKRTVERHSRKEAVSDD